MNASIEVCTSIAKSTLARVLLNTHVITIVNVMAVTMNSVMPRMPPPPDEAAQDGTKNSGRCQRAHSTPRITDARSGPWNASMDDLREVGCEVLTMGQYLRPSPKHLPVVEYIAPEQFDYYGDIARRKGFLYVASGPLVRSSYHAADFHPVVRR